MSQSPEVAGHCGQGTLTLVEINSRRRHRRQQLRGIKTGARGEHMLHRRQMLCFLQSPPFDERGGLVRRREVRVPSELLPDAHVQDQQQQV